MKTQSEFVDDHVNMTGRCIKNVEFTCSSLTVARGQVTVSRGQVIYPQCKVRYILRHVVHVYNIKCNESRGNIIKKVKRFPC